MTYSDGTFKANLRHVLGSVSEKAAIRAVFAAFRGSFDSSAASWISSLIEQGKKSVVSYVNTALVATYWLIGRRIVEYEQEGVEKASGKLPFWVGYRFYLCCEAIIVKIGSPNQNKAGPITRDISDNSGRDIFYHLKNNSLANIRDVISWADNNGFHTVVNMLDMNVSIGRIKSDKDFKTVFSLINAKTKPYFVIILRKNMNLFGYLYDDLVIGDLLEIGIRGIDVDRKEYFIIIFLRPEMLEELKKRHDLMEIRWKPFHEHHNYRGNICQHHQCNLAYSRISIAVGRYCQSLEKILSG